MTFGLTGSIREAEVMADKNWQCGHCGSSRTETDFKVTSLIYSNKWLCEDCAIHEDNIWLENIDKSKYAPVRT
jgi:hypothetical protein